MTSLAHDAELKGNNFRRTVHPQSFIAAAFIFSELDGGGGGGGLPEPPHPVQKIEKKPDLDRVKVVQQFKKVIIHQQLLIKRCTSIYRAQPSKISNCEYA